MYVKYDDKGGNVNRYGTFLYGEIHEVSDNVGEALLKIKGYKEATKEEFEKQEKDREITIEKAETGKKNNSKGGKSK